MKFCIVGALCTALEADRRCLACEQVRLLAGRTQSVTRLSQSVKLGDESSQSFCKAVENN